MTAITFIFPHKCLKCSLHFKVYSSNPDWADRFAYCPECGKKACFPLGREESDQQIFNLVGAVLPEDVMRKAMEQVFHPQKGTE